MLANTLRKNTVRAISHLWALLLLFLVWEAYVTIQDFNSIVLPSPFSVLESIVFQPETYAARTWRTLWVSVAGLLFGSLIGAAFAILGWVSALASGVVAASAIIVRSVPIVVFVPILATMIGYTTTMVVTLVALMSFFPSFVMVSSGLSSLPAAAHDVSAVYGASKWRKLIHIALPASLPNLFASIRLSASRAILATMVAEFLTGIDGLGTLFLLARADLQSEIALGAALIGAAVAVVMYYIADMLEAVVNRRLT